MGNTTISVTDETKDRLDRVGKKQSYDKIINDLLEDHYRLEDLKD